MMSYMKCIAGLIIATCCLLWPPDASGATPPDGRGKRDGQPAPPAARDEGWHPGAELPDGALGQTKTPPRDKKVTDASRRGVQHKQSDPPKPGKPSTSAKAKAKRQEEAPVERLEPLSALGSGHDAAFSAMLDAEGISGARAPGQQALTPAGDSPLGTPTELLKEEAAAVRDFRGRPAPQDSATQEHTRTRALAVCGAFAFLAGLLVVLAARKVRHYDRTA